MTVLSRCRRHSRNSLGSIHSRLRRGCAGRDVSIVLGRSPCPRLRLGLRLSLGWNGRRAAEHLDHPASNAATVLRGRADRSLRMRMCRRRGHVGHLAGGGRRRVGELRARLCGLRCRGRGTRGLRRRLGCGRARLHFLDRARRRCSRRLPLVVVFRTLTWTGFPSRNRSFRWRDLPWTRRRDCPTWVEVGPATGTAREIVADSRITSGTDLRHPSSPAR